MQYHADPFTVFDLSTNLVLVAERETCQVIFANDAVLKLTGYAQPELARLTLSDLYPDLDGIDFSRARPHEEPYSLTLIGADGFQCAVEARVGWQVIEEKPYVVTMADLATDVHTLARELREHRTIYRALITGIFDLFFRIRRDGTYVDFKIPSQTGLYEPETVDEIIGRNVAEVVPPDVTEKVMPVIERVIQTGQPESVAYQIVEETGLHFYDAWFAASLHDEIVAVVRDVTHLRRNEDVLRHQRDLSAVLSSNISLDDALPRVLDTALAIAGMDCGGVYLADQEQNGALRLVVHRGLPDTFIEQASYYPPDALQVRLLMQGESIYTDYPNLPVSPNDAGLQENLRAFAMIPIRHQQNIIGCINLASHAFGSEGIHQTIRDALETTAFHSGSAIVRIRTQEKLRESEEIARTLLNAPHDTAILMDQQFRTLAINEAGARRFQTSVEGLLGQNMLDYMPVSLREKLQDHVEFVLRTGKACILEDDDAGIHFSTTLYPLFDAKGKVARLAVFARDVTIEKQAEQRLQKKDALLEAVAQASNCLLAADNLAVAIQQALELVGRAVQASSAHLFRNHTLPEANEPVTSQSCFWSESAAYSDTIRFALQNQDWHAEGFSAWYELLSAGGTIIGTLADFPKPAQAVLRAFGIKSLLLVPIITEQDHFWGFVGFADHHTEREWLLEEIAALRLMAGSVSAALKRQQVEEHLRRERHMANTLREVGMVLTSTLNLGEVLELILDQAKRVVSYDSATIMLLEGNAARIEVGTDYEKIGLTSSRVKGTLLHLDQTPVLQAILETHYPYLCPDVDKDDNWVYRFEEAWIKSWLGVPIISRGKVVGFFSLDSHAAGFYSESHLQLIQPFAEQAAIAFENASLFAEIQALECVKTEMIRIASHDLRSPLHRIQKALATIKQNGHPVTSQHAPYCDQIADAAAEMQQIIANILSVERIEAQHRSAQAVDWCALLRQSVEMVRADASAKRHKLTLDCANDVPGTRGDPVQLQQAVINLLGNAIKFTPPGGAIVVRVYRKPYGFDQTVAVEIEDNGIGIPLDQQSELYKPFYRAKQSHLTDGLGLGLSIVKTAVEHHHGNVYFKSTPGKGSMFGFWIPVRP